MPATERKVIGVAYGEAGYSPPLDHPAADVPILSTGDNAPEGLTPAVGLGFNLGNCTDTEDQACEPINGFKLWDIGVADAGVTLFNVVDLPDYRYAPAACREALSLPNPAECGGVGEPLCSVYTADLTSGNLGDGKVIYDPDGVGHAAAQYLNVTPLLDEDVTSLYDGSGVPPSGLPSLLLSPSFRAQRDSVYIFQEFFVKPEADIPFAGTIEGKFDVAELTGRENGCIEYSTLTELDQLLYWDVVTKASEIHPGVLRLGLRPMEP